MWLGKGVGQWLTYPSSGFLLKTNDKVLLIDPAGIISGNDVQRLDLLLIAHEHTDHFSKSASVSIQSKTAAVVVVNLGTYSEVFGSLRSEKLVRMRSIETTTISGIKMTVIAAIHGANEPLTYFILFSSYSVFHGSDSGYNSALDNYKGQERTGEAAERMFKLRRATENVSY